MLRRFALPSSTATSVATKSAFAASCASVATAASRNIVVFTAENAVLQNNAKNLKFRSPFWVEDQDLWWVKKVTELKSESEKPTETRVERLTEFYNFDAVQDGQLDAPPQALLDEAAEKGFQYSHAKQKPFAKNIGKQLADLRADNHSFSSPFWINALTVRKRGLRLKKGARKAAVVFGTVAKLYNAEQFEKPLDLQRQPISIRKREPFGGEFREEISQWIVENNFPTGVVATLNQLERVGCAEDIKDGAKPFERAMTFSGKRDKKNQLYNLDDVIDGEKLLDQMQRFEVEAPTFLASGKLISNENLKEAMLKENHKSMYWAAFFDIVNRDFKIKEGAKPLDYNAFRMARNTESTEEKPERTVQFYSIHQLKDPQKVLAAGLNKLIRGDHPHHGGRD